MTAPSATGLQANEYCCYYLLFTSNTYPSKPKIDDVGSAILGDPGPDRGGEGKSKRAGKYGTKKKVKNGEKSPWGQCLTRPVPNGRCRSAF